MTAQRLKMLVLRPLPDTAAQLVWLFPLFGTAGVKDLMIHKGTAVITGAGTAMGGAFADQLANRGYDLILVAPDRHQLLTDAARITDRTGRSVEVFDGDLTTPADLDRIEHALRMDASITLLVNHHDVMGELEVQSAIAMGVTVPTRMAYALAPGFKARGTGTLINMVSVVDRSPGLGLLNESAIESASSAFVLSLSRVLARQLGGAGVRFQTVLYATSAYDPWATVEAALKGFDSGEVFTLPEFIDRMTWNAFEAAWVGLSAKLSSQSHIAPPSRLLH
jgi:uncharacterized protein